MAGIGSHTRPNSGGSDVWITPRDIITRLGRFDLDPCAAVSRPWECASENLTERDDGLSCPWSGRVWMNPPYGKQTALWLEKLAIHANGTALVFARTETKMFQRHVWPKAHALLFIYDRLHFCYIDGERAKGNSGGPSVLIAYSRRDSKFLENSGINGAYIQMK